MYLHQCFFKSSIMRLKVKNLGPIKQGEIDLSKRFSLFVGYNNSGKTYMSQLVWSVFDVCAKMNIFRTIQSIEDVVKDFRDERTFSLADYVVQYYIDGFTDTIKKKVIENFNSNTENNNFSKIEISLPESVKTFKANYYKAYYQTNENFFLVEKIENTLEFNISKIDKNTFLKEAEGEKKYRIQQQNGFNFLDYLYEFIIKNLIDKRFYAPFFLPANRAFYPNFYKYIYEVENKELVELNEAIRQNRPNEELLKISPSNYTQSTRALIQAINQLNFSKSKKNDYYEDLLEELKTIIGGNIVLKTANPDIASLINFKLQVEDSKEELDMHLASSSVNQLTTLYLYLKYWAWSSDNTLIIDEPEENLHPKNQIALLNILMKFANRNNNRVIITTYSPLLADAVNNHLHLGYLAEKYNKNLEILIAENNLNLDPQAALSHDAIGIYFFDGKNIKEYDIEEYGVDFRDFRKEQEKVEEIGDVLRGLIIKEKKNKLRTLHQKPVANV